MNNLAPIFQNFDQSIPLPITDVVGGITYIGYCKRLGIGLDKPEWLIIRVTVTGGLTVPEYSGGDSQYNKVWNDRASLSYSR